MPTTDLLVSWGRPPPRWWRVKDPEEVEEVWSAGWETMAAAAAATECDSDRDRDRDWRLVFARARPGMVAGLSKRVGQECRLGSKKKKKEVQLGRRRAIKSQGLVRGKKMPNQGLAAVEKSLRSLGRSVDVRGGWGFGFWKGGGSGQPPGRIDKNYLKMFFLPASRWCQTIAIIQRS